MLPMIYFNTIISFLFIFILITKNHKHAINID